MSSAAVSTAGSALLMNATAAPINAEYQAQVEEARKRMQEEGEKPAPRPQAEPRRNRPVPALFARKTEGQGE